MRQRFTYKWFFITVLLIGALLVSPHILANQSLFSISEGFLQSFEENYSYSEGQADVDDIEGESVRLKDNFSWSDEISIFNQEVYYLGARSEDLVNGQILVAAVDPGTGETAKGNIVGQYSLLPSQYMDVILYKKGIERDDVFKITQLPENLQEFLPTGEYTIEAQSNVLNGLSVFYGYDTLRQLTPAEAESLNDHSNFITQNAGLKLNLLPGMIVNADYKKSLVNPGVTKDHKSVNVALWPGQIASFSAGVGVMSQISDESTVFSTTLPELVREGLDSSDNTVIRQLGMELHPSDYSKLSADYVSTDQTGSNPVLSKTVFGLRLGDNGKELNATYQLENQENQKTTTSAGVEIGFVDLARLRAVYSKVEENEEDTSKKSTLDLGFNLNFADYTSLDLKYKWALPEMADPEKEQIAEAKLEIKF